MASKKARGKRAKTRAKFSRSGKKRSRVTMNRLLREFATGQKVMIRVESSVHSGMPPKRYHGKTATVTGKRGRAYLVELKVGKTPRTLIVAPAHLHPQHSTRNN
jgi:large subunit ribosomal protein L21e